MRLLIALAVAIATPAAAQVAAPPPADAAPVAPAAAPPPPAADGPPPLPPADTYKQKDVLAAAEATFGKGAEGAAKLIEKAFRDLGEPNAYIVGREASGAFFVGLRYGAGTLYSKVEGAMPVHWTGPSLGLDLGGDGSSVFTLVYHLDDTADLFRRYPGGEGKVYVVGGFTATYNQRDRVILVPIKLGVGLRLGINGGWVNYTRERRLAPF